MVAEHDGAVFSIDGGFEGGDIAGDPAESEVPQSKISAKSEAKHRKRSVFIAVQSLPQTPLDNHNPHMIPFFNGLSALAAIIPGDP
jgi:hypothetical protein